MIPPDHNSDFVAAMENVLDIYRRPYDKDYPLVCMDETPKQLIREMRTPIPAKRGCPEKYDYEYERCGVVNVFIAGEPLAGKRIVKATENKTRIEWARFIRVLADYYPDAKKITLVMDNYKTHKPASLYEAFPPHEAKRLWDRFEFVYTPKHGSWLNMAEIELRILTHQCLNDRMESLSEVSQAVTAWRNHRNNRNAGVNWQFTKEDARVKLARLYPTDHA